MLKLLSCFSHDFRTDAAMQDLITLPGLSDRPIERPTEGAAIPAPYKENFLLKKFSRAGRSLSPSLPPKGTPPAAHHRGFSGRYDGYLALGFWLLLWLPIRVAWRVWSSSCTPSWARNMFLYISSSSGASLRMRDNLRIWKQNSALVPQCC